MDFWQVSYTLHSKMPRRIEIYFKLQAFVIGRPPSVSFHTADCKRPFDLRAVPDAPDEAEPVACKICPFGAPFVINSRSRVGLEARVFVPT